jgi:hypothetical protein
MLIILAISITIGVYIWLGHWAMDKSEAENYFQRVDEEMKPRPEEDYVMRNGTKHPNFSKSQNRLKPTVEKIKAARLDMEFDVVNGRETFLDQNINKNSSYY